MTPTTDEMARYVMAVLDLWSGPHRHHDPMRRPDPRCPWCAIQRPHDGRSDEELQLGLAGSLT